MNSIAPTSDQVLKVAVPLLGMAEAAAALGATLRLRHDGITASPELAARLDAVVGALGIGDAADALEPHETTALLGIVQGLLDQAADFVARPGRDGWDHADPSILMAQGHMSTLIAIALQRFVVPSIGRDLEERLGTPGAACLDVGVGVAALAVALCRAWPHMRVVGIDPWEPALALAREHVAQSGLRERIEVRAGTGETFGDEDLYDLAWVPTFFIPGDALEPTAQRVLTALRPGGWATFGLYARPDDPFIAALADLRTVRQGGAFVTPQEVAAMLERAGFADVGVHFDPEWRLPIVFVAGRRG